MFLFVVLLQNKQIMFPFPINTTKIFNRSKKMQPRTPSPPKAATNQKIQPRSAPTRPNKLVCVELDGLPNDGWINGCIFCYEPTSRTEKHYHYDVAICGKCKKFALTTKVKAVLSRTR